MAKRAALFTNLAGFAAAHGILTVPVPRLDSAGAQFNQGCFVGCEECSGGLGKPQNCKKMEGTVDATLRANCHHKDHPAEAPGLAPVFSPCGHAKGAKNGRDGRDVDGPWTEWTLGSVQKISWKINVNHHGSYAVRLCPLTEELTEECFQRHHLPFEGDEHERTTTGTHPSGSQWTKVPIKGMGEVEDYVKVQGVEPGAYALSLRWDCEQTAQIWAECANINIVADPDDPDDPDDPEYFFQTITPSRNTNLCVDLPGGDTSNGNQLWLWECNGKESQRWRFDNWQIRYAADESKCIDAGDMSEGYQVWLWDCNDHPQQAWGYNSERNQAWMNDGRNGGSICLDYWEDQDWNGQAFHIWPCNGFQNQEWALWDHSPQTFV